MNGADDARRIVRALDRAARRVRLVAALHGAAAGLGIALAAGLMVLARGGSTADAVPLAVAGAVIGACATLLARRRPPAARLIERAQPMHNVVVTAAELLDEPSRARPYIAAAVHRDAARALDAADLRALFPARRAAAALGACTAAWTLALVLAAVRPDALPAVVPFAQDAPAVLGIDVVITPPAYTGAPARTLRDPSRIEAPAGSRIALEVRASAAGVTLETVAGRRDLDMAGPRRFRGELAADADGFIAFEPSDAAGVTGLRRIIGVHVVPDAPPRVDIAEPGRDLVFPDGDRAIDIVVEAADDHGLAALRLSYTKVTGFGEQFTFTDGEVPLDIARESGRQWRARARWDLAPLALEPGDMVVYRATATDRRPEPQAGTSDTWMVEVHTAGAGIAGGFSIEEELDRYALSQQMVIVLTERLLSRRASLPDEAYVAEAQIVSAAQRRVRAEFVFMLGGELDAGEHEDEAEMHELHEEAHARADEDAAMGRLENRGRIELSRAIQSMSRALTALERMEVDAALESERTALDHLQRAFSRSRYILRALAGNERIDLARRLTGALTTASRDVRPQATPAPDPRIAALRGVLADIADLAGDPASEHAGEYAAALARELLRIDPVADPVRDAAAALSDAASLLARGDAAGARARLADAVTTVGALVRVELAPAPQRRDVPALRRLDGALADALRGR